MRVFVHFFFMICMIPFTVTLFGWDQDQRLTFNDGISKLSFNFARCIATDDAGVVHIVWYDSRDGEAQIYYKRSSDRGITWGPDFKISEDSVSSSHPSIAASGTNVYIVWFGVDAGNSNIYFRRSHNGGATWKDTVPLTRSDKSAHPSIAATEEDVHVVWMDSRSGNTEVYTRRSFNQGLTWKKEQRISEFPFESWVPAVAASGKDVFIAWVDYKDANEEEYLRRSRNRGKTWDPPVRLTNDPADSWAPSLVLAGDNIHVAWFDRRNALATDAQVESKLDGAMALVGLPPEPAPPRDPSVYYLPEFHHRIQDKMQRIQMIAPFWVANGGDLKALDSLLREFERKFEQWATGWEIYYKRSTDGGTTWSNDLRLTKARGVSQRPAIAANDKELHIVWFDQRKGNWEVYYKNSDDNGVSWKKDFRLTKAKKDSMHPTIAVSSGLLHVLWFDERDGNAEIYYKRKSTTEP
ncbi:glycoside hydrolase [bacterium]|nr:glycoside hydrolase [bacterium]